MVNFEVQHQLILFQFEWYLWPMWMLWYHCSSHQEQDGPGTRQNLFFPLRAPPLLLSTGKFSTCPIKGTHSFNWQVCKTWNDFINLWIYKRMVEALVSDSAPNWTLPGKVSSKLLSYCPWRITPVCWQLQWSPEWRDVAVKRGWLIQMDFDKEKSYTDTENPAIHKMMYARLLQLSEVWYKGGDTTQASTNY